MKAVGMEVGAQVARHEALGHGPLQNLEAEARAPVGYVEQDARIPRLPHRAAHPPPPVQNVLAPAVKRMGEHVARAEFPENSRKGDGRIPHVRHERNLEELRRLERRVQGPGAAALHHVAAQAHLHADEMLAVPLVALHRPVHPKRAHVDVLAQAVDEKPALGNVQVGANRRPRLLQEPFPEGRIGLRAGAARVHRRRHPAREHRRLQAHAVVGYALVEVAVEIDQARCDDFPRGVQGAPPRGIDAGRHPPHAAAGDFHVHRPLQPLGGIDDVAAAYDDVHPRSSPEKRGVRRNPRRGPTQSRIAGTRRRSAGRVDTQSPQGGSWRASSATIIPNQPAGAAR